MVSSVDCLWENCCSRKREFPGLYPSRSLSIYAMMMRGSSNSSQRMRTTTMSSMKTTTLTMTENKRHHPRVANERRKGRRESQNSFVQRVSILDNADTEENEQLDELVSRRIKKSRSTGRLDLTGLDLTEFPMEIFDVTNDDAPLTDLQISNNRIYHIPDEMGICNCSND